LSCALSLSASRGARSLFFVFPFPPEYLRPKGVLADADLVRLELLSLEYGWEKRSDLSLTSANVPSSVVGNADYVSA
jgi:hypothetical protein